MEAIISTPIPLVKVPNPICSQIVHRGLDKPLESLELQGFSWIPTLVKWVKNFQGPVNSGAQDGKLKTE